LDEIMPQIKYSCCIFVVRMLDLLCIQQCQKVYCFMCISAWSFSFYHFLSLHRLGFTMPRCNYFSIQDWVWIH
jgi:hypothetical protein